MSDRRILEYVMVSDSSAYGITRDINRKMEEGWELYGDPMMSKGRYSENYSQAMVKYETPRQQAERFGFRVTEDDGEPVDHFDEGDFAVD